MNDDIDDGYNPQEMKLKASKLAQAVNEAEDKETEDVMNEFNFLTNTDSVDSIKSAGGGGGQAGGPTSKDVSKGKKSINRWLALLEYRLVECLVWRRRGRQAIHKRVGGHGHWTELFKTLI